ncbi:anti-RNA polymerase sigma 70 factor [Enterovibrio norvegicus]|uniref:Regulator of sigma D n=2 Tax=Enterovibrio norvegicus TaxID=188144 RepID=A0A1I5UMC0_9GAMM|nr:Rsd/AlgQ family anti-sigma factor [Enterovibrio norvegicus]MCC4798809.1 Rsd/AlgQ family anti-sigma factor [Enterovibrio norvegicus]OEF60770.1 anti-RNA polymerase sigma 70 factor [Enterovibrio norvegicus]PMH62846.1 anti-RNA polymerase sigma 70 factor [Enterovibrio norvegicus]PMI35033.1 anti-RNA polymerase sigma 70 factor [Enterovibrio norvegicus]PMN46295.1 anti-RNA polymerase sigma 70 factor [Enterovibrio norvegicus]
MLNKLEKAQQQWGGYSDVIDYWLTLRQELLVEYSKMAGLSGGSKTCLPTEEKLNQFCGALVDYISAGHFKIYDMVMERWKSTGFSSNAEIDTLYARIVETTEPLLNFNDKYSSFVLDEDNFAGFDNDISVVGEIMEMRFEQEDMLIQLIADSLAIPPGA